MRLKPLLLVTFSAIFLLTAHEANTFCGFFVAKADATLFNQSSQVIMARHDGRSVVTMQNDFRGAVKDFAIVVPVPTVLEEKDIKVVSNDIFARLDGYSGPRLAEYYDDNPCTEPFIDDYEFGDFDFGSAEEAPEASPKKKTYGVTIEAEYTVGEYDIMILSAKRSNGLQQWLNENGYHTPDVARDILKSYIKQDMKFFVVKVNLEEFNKSGFTQLRPIQISYESEKMMLPIRLGMANAKGYQDLIIYTLTQNGRAEVSNYPTRKLPTDMDVPLSVQNNFGVFYKLLFERAWRNYGRRSVLLEYAWDLSGSNFTKCDPCATTPPTFAELQEAGAWWVKESEPDGWRSSANYTGDLFFTRLHVRYAREHYPEDLTFIETPNKESYQCRYVIRHKAEGDLSCEEGQQYIKDLRKRRAQEQQNLLALTGRESLGAAPRENIPVNEDLEDLDNELIPLLFDTPEPPEFWPQLGVWQISLIVGALSALLLLFVYRRRQKLRRV